MFYSINVDKWVQLFKGLSKTSSPEIVDSVNALILADRRVTIEENPEFLWVQYM